LPASEPHDLFSVRELQHFRRRISIHLLEFGALSLLGMEAAIFPRHLRFRAGAESAFIRRIITIFFSFLASAPNLKFSIEGNNFSFLGDSQLQKVYNGEWQFDNLESGKVRILQTIYNCNYWECSVH
jgi:hypothetical protein